MLRARLSALTLISLSPSLAWGGVDALGPQAPVLSTRLDAPARGLGVGGAGWSGSAALEYVRSPVVRVSETGATQTLEPLLRDGVAVRLSGAYAPARRLSLGVSAPVLLGATGADAQGGPALGTVEVVAALGLLVPSDEGLRVSVAPFVTLPPGDAARWVRDPGVGGGALVGVAFTQPRWSLSASGGPEYRRGESESLSSGAAFRGHVGAGALLRPRLGVTGELTGRSVRGGRLPIEGTLAARIAVSDRLRLHASLSRGLTSAVGSPAARAQLGLSVVGPRRSPAATPRAPAPSGPGGPRLRVLDPDGEPIGGVSLVLGDRRVAVSDAEGHIALPRRRRARAGTLTLPGYVPLPVPERVRGEVSVTLPWADVPVRMEVVDQVGESVAAEVYLASQASPDDVTVATPVAGFVSFDLAPGVWQVEVVAEGFASQRRDFDVVGGRSTPLTARVVMAPALVGPTSSVSVVLRDASGAPIEGADVLIDGVPYGTTGSGGALALSGVALGVHEVEVFADRFEPLVLEELVLGEDGAVAALTMDRRPGGVHLSVRGDAGPVADAVVRLSGPSRLPSYPLGDDGERFFQLRPGDWSLLVTSATLGIQSTEVRVDPDVSRVVDVEVYLGGAEGGAAELSVLAVDGDGRPLAHVQVSLDGERVGTTATGGRITLPDRLLGARRLELSGAAYEPVERGLFLVAGPQEERVVMSWVDGATEVVARTPRGAVADGVARFSGDGDVDALPLSEDGRGFVPLPGGTWDVLVTSPARGMASQSVDVIEDSGRLAVAEVVFPPDEAGDAGLHLRVRDPLGEPVAGAEVRLDGRLVGVTNPRGLLALDNLAVGSRRVEVAAALLVEASRSVALRDGDNRLSLALDWAPGAVRVVAEGPDGPVDDAVVRFMGPASRAPQRLGETGERLIALTPGAWQGLASSPSYGMAEASIVIGEEGQGLRTLAFAFAPVARGRADLLLRVVDPRGAPVVGAVVEVAGLAPRTTGEAGVVLVPDLPAEAVNVALNADLFYPREVRDLTLRPGAQERVIVLSPVKGTVDATIVHADGAPVSGQLRFLGPEDVAPLAFSGGHARVDLPPGAWRVLAAAPGFGTRSVTLDVPAGAHVWPVSFSLEPAQVRPTEDGFAVGDAVLFAVGHAELRDEAGPVLDEMAAFLLADPTLEEIEVQGHTDASGSVALNMALSTARALAVREALESRGVPPERLRSRGYGSTRPLETNDTAAGRRTNRRVEFVVHNGR